MTVPQRSALAIAASVIASPFLLEFGLRLLNGNAHGALPLYASLAPPALVPLTEAEGLLGSRHYSVALDDRGFRRPSAASGTVLLGDSLAFGLGLDDADTLAAVCNRNGVPMINAAAPAFSAIDALIRGGSLASVATDFLLIVNPWDDDNAPLAEDFDTVSGWLVHRDAPGWVRSVLASPFAAWQLPHDVAQLASMAHPHTPARVGWVAVGQAIESFVGKHLQTRVVWGGYPTATMPDGRSVATARGELAAAMPAISLLDLSLHDAWIEGDLHWSPAGTAEVAAQLCAPSPTLAR